MLYAPADQPTDPEEQHDRYAENASEAAHLRELADGYWAAMEAVRASLEASGEALAIGEEPALDNETKEKLRALGYLVD